MQLQLRETDLFQVDTCKTERAAARKRQGLSDGAQTKLDEPESGVDGDGGGIFGDKDGANLEAKVGGDTRQAAADGWLSALEIVVQFEVHAFLSDPFLTQMIFDKWVRFGRRMYLVRTVIPYLLMLACFVTLVLLRTDEARIAQSNR